MNRSTITRTLVRGIRLLVVTTLLAGWAMALQPATPAHAANITVTTAADTYDVGNPGGCGTVLPGDLPGGGDGLVSLREAICAANNDAGFDTITFDAATDGTPIVLGGAAGDDANASGDLDILAAGGDLTIQGNGAGATIIDGNNNDRVFHVCPGAACANTVTLSGVTIRNGDAGWGNGGGILNGATLNVQNSTIGGAGADNQAWYGGGLYNQGLTTVDNSTVSANTATFNGGGIYNQAGTMTLDASTVISNTAISGGGIWNSATLTITNSSTIGGTGAANQAVDGGGIYNLGTTTVDGSTVSANTAANGGGIWNQGTLNVRNGSTVSANTAPPGNGGGIYNQGGTTTVDNSTVISNTADWGGGIWNEATLNVVNGSTIGGAGAGNQAGAGGGICNALGTTTVDGSTVSANTATTGGIWNWWGTTTVTGSRILYNTATTDGGGLYNDCDIAGATSVTNSCIVGNSATSFRNNQPAQQTATGNWWGAWTGPNTPGADTVGGNVDTSGFLTAPILGCPSTARPSGGGGDDEGPPPPPTAIPAPQAREFNCWPWLVVVPPGAAPKAVPGEWCQASLGQPLPAASAFRYLGHSTEVTVKDAAGAAITQFAQPIQVCFHYTQPELDAVGGDPADFLFQVWRDGKWDALDTKPDGSLRYPGVCAPVDHLTLFALFARDGATLDASAAAAENPPGFPKVLLKTGERPFGSGGRGLVVTGAAILALVAGAWLLRRR